MIWSCVIMAIAGGLWRRALGGWLGGSRALRFAVMPLLAWPLFLKFPLIAAIILTGLCGWFFAAAHVVETPWKRYGPFGIAYWAALKFWPREWQFLPFIDGPAAVGELLLGALFWGSLPLVLL